MCICICIYIYKCICMCTWIWECMRVCDSENSNTTCDPTSTGQGSPKIGNHCQNNVRVSIRTRNSDVNGAGSTKVLEIITYSDPVDVPLTFAF